MFQGLHLQKQYDTVYSIYNNSCDIVQEVKGDIQDTDELVHSTESHAKSNVISEDDETCRVYGLARQVKKELGSTGTSS